MLAHFHGAGIRLNQMASHPASEVDAFNDMSLGNIPQVYYTPQPDSRREATERAAGEGILDCGAALSSVSG